MNEMRFVSIIENAVVHIYNITQKVLHCLHIYSLGKIYICKKINDYLNFNSWS